MKSTMFLFAFIIIFRKSASAEREEMEVRPRRFVDLFIKWAGTNETLNISMIFFGILLRRAEKKAKRSIF